MVIHPRREGKVAKASGVVLLRLRSPAGALLPIRPRIAQSCAGAADRACEHFDPILQLGVVVRAGKQARHEHEQRDGSYPATMPTANSRSRMTVFEMH
jgi:hypothetical protein